MVIILSFELGAGIQTWEDLKTAIAVYQWLHSTNSYVELQQFLMDHIIQSLRALKENKEISTTEGEPKND